jgi:extracellular factor (EF) 3-hydroxypalmitic acid methyl ester biosynthesis protein
MNATSSTMELLDWAHDSLRNNPGQLRETMLRLSGGLCQTYREEPAEVWAKTIATCRAHPLCTTLHEDPLTRRTFSQPRGYAGDAELLDIIYRRDWRGVEQPPTRLGQGIFDFTIGCRAPSAVRFRREVLAAVIDDACRRKAAPHILSVACGHLRELAQSAEFRARRVGRLVGLDQDEQSLAEVVRSQPDGAVQTVPGSIKLLFGRTFAGEKFDFIYTAGLYDYLDDKLARRLTQRMFELLNPGGRLLIANFRPGVEDVGYMEAFMKWTLIYRDSTAMERVAATVPQNELANQRVFDDATQTLVFLELTRNG